MIKFPYILDYSLFQKVEIVYAEELLNEYYDFYEYNKLQVSNMFSGVQDTFSSADDNDDQAIQERVEHNRQVSLDHFTKLFGSKDFAESALVGLKIDFYGLQQILLDEFRSKTSIIESAMNQIAPKLRAVASVLLFAERIISGLEKLLIDTAVLEDAAKNKAAVNNEKIELAIEFAKDGFNLLLERLQTLELNIPEFHKTKKDLNKIKTMEAYIDFCEKLFFI